MGFSHNPIWCNLVRPSVIKVEHGGISAFSILRGPIKINKHDTTFTFALGCNIENIGVLQVCKDNIKSMKALQCVLGFLRDNCRNWCSLLLELPNGLPIHTVHNDHV